MKEFDGALVDDSVSLVDVERNTTTDERARSVQSRSYDVMYCTTSAHRHEGMTDCTVQFYHIHCVHKKTAPLSMFKNLQN